MTKEDFKYSITPLFFGNTERLSFVEIKENNWDYVLKISNRLSKPIYYLAIETTDRQVPSFEVHKGCADLGGDYATWLRQVHRSLREANLKSYCKAKCNSIGNAEIYKCNRVNNCNLAKMIRKKDLRLDQIEDIVVRELRDINKNSANLRNIIDIKAHEFIFYREKVTVYEKTASFNDDEEEIIDLSSDNQELLGEACKALKKAREYFSQNLNFSWVEVEKAFTFMDHISKQTADYSKYVEAWCLRCIILVKHIEILQKNQEPVICDDYKSIFPLENATIPRIESEIRLGYENFKYLDPNINKKLKNILSDVFPESKIAETFFAAVMRIVKEK